MQMVKKDRSRIDIFILFSSQLLKKTIDNSPIMQHHATNNYGLLGGEPISRIIAYSGNKID